MLYNEKIKKFKHDMIDYLNQDIEDEEEKVDVLDVFMYDGGRSLRLTHYGYRKLSDYYEFFELDFDFELNVVYSNALDRLSNAPYYYKFEKRDGKCRLKTSDRRFMKRLKIANYDLINLLS